MSKLEEIQARLQRVAQVVDNEISTQMGKHDLAIRLLVEVVRGIAQDVYADQPIKPVTLDAWAVVEEEDYSSLKLKNIFSDSEAAAANVECLASADGGIPPVRRVKPVTLTIESREP